MPTRVSVIVPSYNYGNYLFEAIDSLLSQTFTDWEAIVIDDASTDNTSQIINKFYDPRIKVISHSINLGNIATFNEGIALAKGEFIALLSADDRYHPSFLSESVKILDDHPDSAMSYTDIELIDKNGYFIDRVDFVPHKKTGIYNEIPALLYFNYIGHCSALVRSKIYKEVGPYTFIRAGDWEMFLRIAKKYLMAYISLPLYHYRQHRQNMSIQSETMKIAFEEFELIINNFFLDPDLSQDFKKLEKEVRASWRWQMARAWLTTRNFDKGFHILKSSIREDPTLLLSPKKLIQMTVSFIRGITGLGWKLSLKYSRNIMEES